MILEIDYGNTRLKWRLLDSHEMAMIARGASCSVQKLVNDVNLYTKQPIRFCRVCSVRKAFDNNVLTEFLLRCFNVQAVYAVSDLKLAGVTNGYADAAKLGVDRWLALVAAYKIVQRSCLVFDFGTAITVDYVSAEGLHLGGCIAPGMQMIKAAFNSCTQQLAGVELDVSSSSSVRGNNTQSAISTGVATMFKGFVQEHVAQAAREWEADFQVVCTGGDGGFVSAVTKSALFDEDLVFKGLAIACPFVDGV